MTTPTPAANLARLRGLCEEVIPPIGVVWYPREGYREQVSELIMAVPMILADLDAALALLRRLYTSSYATCPNCGYHKHKGPKHAPDCELAALLVAHPAPKGVT